MKQGLRKFERQVSDMLPCSKEVKEGQLEQMRRSLEERSDELNYNELVEEIGSPESMAAGVIQEMDGKDVALAMRTRNRIFRIAAVFLGTILIIFTIAMTIAVIDGHKASGSIRTITEASVIWQETIPEETTP